MVMTLPLGVTVPLPDVLHSIRVTRYTADFALAKPPRRDPGESGETESPQGDPTESAPAKSAAGPEAGEEAVEPVPRENRQANPAAHIVLFREGEPVGKSWIFQRAPYLFQPSNMRYTFALLGARGSG